MQNGTHGDVNLDRSAGHIRAFIVCLDILANNSVRSIFASGLYGRVEFYEGDERRSGHASEL